MTKKNWLLVIFLVALAGVYVIWFTDWLKPKNIHIFHTVREMHYRRAGADAEPALIFGIEPPQRITEIKVVALADFEKNPETLPVWHLVADTGSEPVKDFIYGGRVRGMKPAVAGSEASLLDTNLVYRIFIKAGKSKGQHDFKIGNTPAQNTTSGNS